jgi:facilitated trehalose transporter
LILIHSTNPKNSSKFQDRKHKSLDPRHISFKFEKEPSPTSSDEEELTTSLLKIDPDITKPVVIDFKDLDSSDEEEEFSNNRKDFQKSKSMSSASRKSVGFFGGTDDIEMNGKDEASRQSIPFVRQISEYGSPKLEVYRPTTNPIYIYTQVSLIIII